MSFCMPIRPHFSELPDEELLCPLCDEQDGWERPEESGMALDQNGIVDAMDGVDEVDESGGVIRLPKGLPAPTLPSKSEIGLHNSTHIPYRNWCPHCVAARRKNDPHLLSLDERTVPRPMKTYAPHWLEESFHQGHSPQFHVSRRGTMSTQCTDSVIFLRLRA